MSVVAHPHVETGDVSLVRGTRVPVWRLWYWHTRGISVRSIVDRYPQLGWARILDALSFAHDNASIVENEYLREGVSA